MEQAEADRAVSQMSSDEASDGKHRVKEEDKEFWKRRRKQWKENMKTAKASFMTKEEYMNSDLFARRREREETKKRWRSLPLDEMKLYPPDIVIDLEYDADMPDKVRHSATHAPKGPRLRNFPSTFCSVFLWSP